MTSYPLPEGHHTVVPAFALPGVARAIDFLIAVFDAKVVDRYDGPNGRVFHAEIRIGDSVVMCGDGQEDMNRPAMMSIYVEDVDATYQKALAAGAVSVQAPTDQFYGHRTARVTDPLGNQWSMSRVIEQLTRAQIEERMAKSH
jgi:PhnB protein